MYNKKLIIFLGCCRRCYCYCTADSKRQIDPIKLLARIRIFRMERNLLNETSSSSHLFKSLGRFLLQKVRCDVFCIHSFLFNFMVLLVKMNIESKFNVKSFVTQTIYYLNAIQKRERVKYYIFGMAKTDIVDYSISLSFRRKLSFFCVHMTYDHEFKLKIIFQMYWLFLTMVKNEKEKTSQQEWLHRPQSRWCIRCLSSTLK